MGSDLHINPPLPPERVIAVSGTRVAYYVRQIDGIFSGRERENFSRVGGVDLLNPGDVPAVRDFAKELLGGLTYRVVTFAAGIELAEWMPQSAFKSQDAKRARLRELEAEAVRLRAELGC